MKCLTLSLAKQHGFYYERHLVTTEDGFVLCIERIRKGAEAGVPIILQHGLFQSSGIFVLGNNKDSPAFYLANQGYDVWLGNNRGVFPNHNTHNPKDKEYWDWCLDDLGRYDFPAIISYVNNLTKQKVVFVGHSQGNAQAFVGLSMVPNLASKVKLFIALAPAYYINDFKHWTLKSLQKMHEENFDKLFGNHDFISIMHDVQTYFPKRLFSSLAFNMYSYIFEWTDTNWRNGQKPSFFQVTPRPISAKLVKHWLSISRKGSLHCFTQSEPAPTLSNLKCPVAVFYGGSDFLVDGARLVKHLPESDVQMVYSKEIREYDHMDLVWGITAIEEVWKDIASLSRETELE